MRIAPRPWFQRLARRGREAVALGVDLVNAGGPRVSVRAIEEAVEEPLGQLDGVLGESVHRLPGPYRDLIALRFGRGLTIAQIARVTRRSKAEVRMDQLRALRALQHEIESRASG